MYSGSDSTESQNLQQWALNPSTYQNMANDQVDWAALAQQWIIMKEAGPPPIPGEQPVLLKNQKNSTAPPGEGGEAPMDMETEKEESPAWAGPPPPVISGSDCWNWNVQQQSWGWNNNWNAPSAVPPPPGIMKPPLLPTPNNFNQFSAPPESSSDNAVPFGGGSGPNNDYPPVYWTNNKVMKPHNRRYSKVNVPRPVSSAPIISETPIAPPPPTLDAAKRKQLPAWIREGLEKMERDKLKQQEKEREKQEREIYNEKMKQSEKEKMEILKSTMKEQQKSRFESDGEYSDEESSLKKPVVKAEITPLTQEELMLKVRRMMTEILLKVTSGQIESICREEQQRFLKKMKASDHRASAPSGANISAKLGLGIYGEDSGSSDDSEEEYHREKRDSDSELKDIIKRKISDFSKTEREIEEKLAEAESRKSGANVSRASSPDSNDNDSQVDARLQGRRIRSPDRTPPPSRNSYDLKSKQRSPSSSSDNSDSYTNSRSKTSRRSSSSDSIASHKRTKKKQYNSRSRSRTPSKKYSKQDKYSSNVKSNSTRRSKSPLGKRRSRSRSRSRRNSNGSRKNYNRSRSRSYSRSRRSRSSSYKRSKRSYSREKYSKRKSRSTSRSRYSKSRRSRSKSSSRSNKRRRSRSISSSRGKRSHRY